MNIGIELGTLVPSFFPSLPPLFLLSRNSTGKSRQLLKKSLVLSFYTLTIPFSLLGELCALLLLQTGNKLNQRPDRSSTHLAPLQVRGIDLSDRHDSCNIHMSPFDSLFTVFFGQAVDEFAEKGGGGTGAAGTAADVFEVRCCRFLDPTDGVSDRLK